MLSAAATAALLSGALLVPGAALAGDADGSGGSGLGPNGGGTPDGSANAPRGVSVPSNGQVTASGNGITIATQASTLLRSPLRFSGQVTRSAVRRIVEIERRTSQTHGHWAATTHGSVRADGSFTAVWPTNHPGRFAVRAVLEGAGGSISRATPASPSITVTVYRPAIATIYGPGFFGQRTACGAVLHRSTLGVANRTLPCGTPVSILWHGRTIEVPVIDRGPYANGADWDLTSATASALRMPGTETIGAVPLRR